MIKKLGLMIIKPPISEDLDSVKEVISFSWKILRGPDVNSPRACLRYHFAIENGGEIFKEIYSNLNWEGKKEMLDYFENKPVFPVIFQGVENVQEDLKRITGKTENENDILTIRGYCRSKYGVPQKEYLNFVHTPKVKDLGLELELIAKYNSKYKSKIERLREVLNK